MKNKKNIRTCSGAKQCLHFVENKLHCCIIILPPLKQQKQSSQSLAQQIESMMKRTWTPGALFWGQESYK